MSCIVCYVLVDRSMEKTDKMDIALWILNQLLIGIIQTCGFSVEYFASYQYNVWFLYAKVPVHNVSTPPPPKKKKKQNPISRLTPLQFEAYFLCTYLQNISQIILVCRHSKHFISGKEGHLPVGFPDRFNSSSISYWMRFRQVPLWRYEFKVIFDEYRRTIL